MFRGSDKQGVAGKCRSRGDSLAKLGIPGEDFGFVDAGLDNGTGAVIQRYEIDTAIGCDREA